MQQRPRVYILRGGPSEQYDISLRTGVAVLDALTDSEEFAPKDIVISQGGEWLVNGKLKRPEQALTGADVVFNAMHGTYGEDGQLQRLLDHSGIPYTGSKQFASRTAINKSAAKQVLGQAGIKTPRGIRIRREQTESLHEIIRDMLADLGSPLVIKPNNSGSSMGVTIAHNTEETVAAVTALLQKHTDILVEEFIDGREATCGVLERYRHADLYDLPAVEILQTPERFLSFAAKQSGQAEHRVPGRFSNYDKRRLSDMAKLAHQTIGASQYSRSDFMVTPSDIYCLEVNTLPDLAATSLFPIALGAVGGLYRELVHHLLHDTLRR